MIIEPGTAKLFGSIWPSFVDMLSELCVVSLSIQGLNLG